MWNPFGDLCALCTLIVLEIILGLDNFLFVSKRLACFPAKQSKTSRIKLAAISLLTRWAVLWTVLRLIHCQFVFFTVDGFVVTLRELVLVSGGLFLFCKCILQPLNFEAMLTAKNASKPLHPGQLEKRTQAPSSAKNIAQRSGGLMAILAITAVDSLCSIDSVLSAVALSERLWLILSALVVAEVLMVLFHARVESAMASYKASCIYANVFVALLGAVLVFRGLGVGLPNDFIYTGMGVLLLAITYNVTRGSGYLGDQTKSILTAQFLSGKKQAKLDWDRLTGVRESTGSDLLSFAKPNNVLTDAANADNFSYCDCAYVFENTPRVCPKCHRVSENAVYTFGVLGYDS